MSHVVQYRHNNTTEYINTMIWVTTTLTVLYIIIQLRTCNVLIIKQQTQPEQKKRVIYIKRVYTVTSKDNSDDDSEDDDVQPIVKKTSYLSTLINNNEKVVQIIKMEDGTKTICKTRYIDGRFVVNECASLPSIIGKHFYTPTKMYNRITTLLKHKRQYSYKQKAFDCTFVVRNGIKTSLSSLK